MALSKQCFAFKKLKRQIGEQCVIYKELSETGRIGSMAGMYQKTKDGRSIPGENAAAYLRGGVITTMACFEAFLHDLLEEAVYNIKYMRDDHDNESPHAGGKCLNCEEYLDYKHIFSEKKKRELPKEVNVDEGHANFSPMLHGLKNFYSKSLKISPETDIIDLMELDKCPMNYYYLLDGRWVSHVEIKSGNVICLLLRLFYGIRCIMAHGNSSKTLEYPGVLTHFPNCAECIDPEKWAKIMKYRSKGEEMFKKIEKHDENRILKDEATKIIDTIDCTSTSISAKLKSIKTLSDIYNDCIEEQGKCKVLETARKFPKKKPIEKLGDPKLKKKGTNLLDQLFSECDSLDQRNLELISLKKKGTEIWQEEQRIRRDPELDMETKAKKAKSFQQKYCEINKLYWKQKLLDENYAFFHLCRIHHWLEEDEKDAYVTYNMLVRINQFILLLAHRMRFAVAKHMMKHFGLRDRTWNVPKDDAAHKEKIKKFEEKHKDKVYELQKSTVLAEKTV